MTTEQFDEDQKRKFKLSIASAAGVSFDDVGIDNVESMRRSGRQLLAGSIRIEMSIVAADQKAAASMVDMLDVDTINAELRKNDLPEAEILDPPKAQPIISGPSSPKEQNSNSMPIIIGSVVAAAVVLFASGTYFFTCKRSTKDTDDQVWTDTARESSSRLPEADIMSPGPNLMSTPRIPQAARSMRDVDQEETADQQETADDSSGDCIDDDFSELREQTTLLDEVAMNVDGTVAVSHSPRATLPVHGLAEPTGNLILLGDIASSHRMRSNGLNQEPTTDAGPISTIVDETIDQGPVESSLMIHDHAPSNIEAYTQADLITILTQETPSNTSGWIEDKILPNVTPATLPHPCDDIWGAPELDSTKISPRGPFADVDTSQAIAKGKLIFLQPDKVEIEVGFFDIDSGDESSGDNEAGPAKSKSQGKHGKVPEFVSTMSLQATIKAKIKAPK